MHSDKSTDEHEVSESRPVCSAALARTQLNGAITQIGPGPYQLIVLGLGGGVYTAEGSLLLMLSVIAKSLIIRWKLSAMFAGAMVTVIFVGLLAGTILGGFLCDRYGRRMPILVTYSGMTIFLAVSLMAPDILLLVTAKFMLGVSLGFGVPAANAVICESCPTEHRSNVYSMTMVLFSLGQMYSACILWAMSPEIKHSELHWRMMLVMAAILPCVLGILSYFFLLESPHWLLAQGQYSDAKEVVIKMAEYKGNVPLAVVEAITYDLQTPAPSPEAAPRHPKGDDHRVCCSQDQSSQWWQQVVICICAMKEDMGRFKHLFSERFRLTTILMSYISFVSNFVYYGLIYGLPDTLKKEHGEDSSMWSPAAGVFFSAVFEIPGVFIAILLGTTVGRKMNMTISFGCTAFSLACVIWVMSSGRLENAGLLAVFSVKLFIASVFIIVYLYLLECYPTKFRATGLAFCMVIGRLGAFACPFLFDGLVLAGVHHKWFFIVMCGLVLLASIISYLLPYETKDSQLMQEEDEAPELEEHAPRTFLQPQRRLSAEGTPLRSANLHLRSYTEGKRSGLEAGKTFKNSQSSGAV